MWWEYEMWLRKQLWLMKCKELQSFNPCDHRYATVVIWVSLSIIAGLVLKIGGCI